MFDIGPERARHYDPRRPAMTMYYESPEVNFGADMDETLISIRWIMTIRSDQTDEFGDVRFVWTGGYKVSVYEDDEDAVFFSNVPTVDMIERELRKAGYVERLADNVDVSLLDQLPRQATPIVAAA
jgi:hypothetical protein